MFTRLLVIVVILGVYGPHSPAIAQYRVTGEPEALYFEHCASCHGRDFLGGSDKSLVNPAWLEDDALGQLIQTISEGLPQAGMPAWKDQLDAQQIRALAILIREAVYFDLKNKKQTVYWDASSVFESEAHSFALETVARVDSRLWALDFLPDGSILSTQHNGKLWRFKNGKRTEIKNIPPSYHYRQGGLLDVMVHPEYDNEGWIYLTLGEKNPNHEAGSTTVVRGKIIDEQWMNTEYLFRIPEDEGKSGVFTGDPGSCIRTDTCIFLMVMGGKKTGHRIRVTMPGKFTG
jgi:cytochrome c553